MLEKRKEGKKLLQCCWRNCVNHSLRTADPVVRDIVKEILDRFEREKDCYTEKLSDTQLLADVIHEVSHITFRHFEREEMLEITNPIHKKAYDYASDIVVNAILVASGFDVYDTGLNPERIGRKFVTRFKFSIRGLVNVNGIRQEIVVQIPIEIWDPEQKSSEEVYLEILEQLRCNGSGNSNIKMLLPGCSA